MKIRDKNPVLKSLLVDLNEKGLKAPVWKAVAKGLNRPSRIGHEMNVQRLSKLTKAKEKVIVPGVVLAIGEIDKPITVAALRFTETAQKKIEKAGGHCLSIEDMMEKEPKGSGLRVLG
ncbi:MAG: 50S ribosomal protein L18e [Candidatus Aenigmatarchaeota archaeon]